MRLNCEETYEDWDIRFTIVDNKTGLELEFGGGYLSPDQVETLWDIAKSLTKSEDYKEEIDPDIGYLTDPPEEDLD